MYGFMGSVNLPLILSRRYTSITGQFDNNFVLEHNIIISISDIIGMVKGII